MADNKIVLVTGAAGFIGFHLTQKLVSQGYEVVGIDNLNDYYDPRLKHSRLDILKSLKELRFPGARSREQARDRLIFSRNIRFRT